MEFPHDMLVIIFSNLEDLSDQARFSLVSKSWRYVALQQYRPQLSWLMIPTQKNKLNFFDMLSGKLHNFMLPKPLRGGIPRGSSKGWLVISKGSGLKTRLFLFNPLTRFHIELPSIETIPTYRRHFLEYWVHEDSYDLSYFIQRIELSCAGLSSCTIAMVCDFDDCEIAVCSPYSKTWFCFRNPVCFIEDILFSGSVLFALSWKAVEKTKANRILKYDGHKKVRLKIVSKFGLVPPVFEDEIVEAAYYDDYSFERDCVALLSLAMNQQGELLIVEMIQNGFVSTDGEAGSRFIYRQTSKIRVFKVKPNNAEPIGWSATQVDHLGDQILFVGQNGSTSVGASELIRARGFKTNRVYFEDSQEVGVFCLDDNTIKRPFPSTRQYMDCLITWFTPRLG